MLYQKYKDRGFVVLGFPCNQLANQEPGNEEEIYSFCTVQYNVTFPMFAKVDVKGKNAPYISPEKIDPETNRLLNEVRLIQKQKEE